MSEIEFETLKVNNNYEISINHYPYIIRNIKTKRVIKETINGDDYHEITLQHKRYRLHRVVAEQWIENDDPENKIQVDHINHDRGDNRIENLRWCTRSENMKNKSKHNGIIYEYIEELSDEAFEVTEYNKHEFEDLWFDPDSNCFYYYTGAAYREIHYEKRNDYALRIRVPDINHVITSISLSKFKKVYNLN